MQIKIRVLVLGTLQPVVTLSADMIDRAAPRLLLAAEALCRGIRNLSS